MTDTPFLFIPVGGFGSSQLGQIVAAVAGIPGAIIAKTPDWNGYEGKGIWNAITANPNVPIILCGHSMGGPTAREAANALGPQRATGLIILDNVEWDQNPVTTTCPNVRVFQAANSFPFHITPVVACQALQVGGTNHNNLCQNPTVKELIVAFVQNAVESAVKGPDAI